MMAGEREFWGEVLVRCGCVCVVVGLRGVFVWWGVCGFQCCCEIELGGLALWDVRLWLCVGLGRRRFAMVGMDAWGVRRACRCLGAGSACLG